MRRTDGIVLSLLSLSAACSGGVEVVKGDAGPEQPVRVTIDPAVVATASTNLASLAPSLASTSPLHALAAQAAAAALETGTKATPVTLTASLLGGTGSRSAALSSGPAQAFGFQVVLLNPPQPVPTLSGVLVLQGGGELVLVVGPAPPPLSSSFPPAAGGLPVGLLVNSGTEAWKATLGQEGAKLDTEAGPCTPIPGVTPFPGVTSCKDATFTDDQFAITASAPITTGATGSRTASLPVQALAGVSLIVDCALTTLCGGTTVILGPASYFFAADNGANGVELWDTDGTPAGTTLVKDINPTGSSNPTEFTVFGDFTYFRADDGVHGGELWRTDGTAAGTTMVADINPGSGSSAANGFTVLGSELIFQASGQLWKTDGTAAGTVMVKDVGASSLHEFGGAVYFAGKTVHPNGSETELWRTDGTAAGTVMVKDIYPGDVAPGSVPGSGLGAPPGFAEFNGQLYFEATDGVTGFELWKTDGTAAGTALVKDIVPGAGASFPEHFTVAGGLLFFLATNPAGGLELWKTDGTNAGTVLVKAGLNPFNLTVVNDRLYFSCLAPGGASLCTSDGTSAGTGPVTPGATPSRSSHLAAGLGVLFFQGFQATSGSGSGTGAEIWRSDGTAGGTMLLKDVNPGSASSFATRFTPVRGVVVFLADDGTHGSELWVTDGTAVGTMLLKDINAGAASGVPPGTCDTLDC
jgi:ELWxxDGT repeat protein